MCDKQSRIDELQAEIYESRMRQSRMMRAFYSHIEKEVAESESVKSQTLWHPCQVVLIPVVIAIIGGVVSIVVAVG